MEKSEVTIPEEVTQVTQQLIQSGHDAYLVGGCVRDLLLNRTPKDWDVATNATPKDMLQIFDSSEYDNKYGTVRVKNDTEKTSLQAIEVTTFRTENTYSDNRRPDSIDFADTIHEDLTRRDFTINAFALDMDKVSRDRKVSISHETLIDDHGGLVDLEHATIRSVGDESARFEEDALRIMRAIRFAAELGFALDADTKQAMMSHVKRLNDIAIERIREEFEKIIMSSRPKVGLEIARDVGALSVFIPELQATIDIDQNQAHKFDLWTHLINAAQVAADKGWPEHIRLAALFHDIAKVQTREWDDQKDDWTFHNHEVAGSRVTERVMNRMKFSNSMISQVTNLVRWHMFYSDTDDITHSAVRRLIRNVGKDNVWDLMKLRRADRLGMGRPKEEPYRLRKYQAMIEEVIRDPVSVKQLAIDGDDVLRETSEDPGPRIGHILHALLERVIDDPDHNKKELLLEDAQKLAELSDKELEKFGTRGRKQKERLEKEAVSKIRKKYWVQ